MFKKKGELNAGANLGKGGLKLVAGQASKRIRPEFIAMVALIEVPNMVRAHATISSESVVEGCWLAMWNRMIKTNLIEIYGVLKLARSPWVGCWWCGLVLVAADRAAKFHFTN